MDGECDSKAGVDAADPALSEFLAQHDAACPGCGYNLRGCGGAACPECGRGLRLQLDPGKRGVAHRMFLVLALGWVLIASAMNTFRAVQVIRAELAMAQRAQGQQIIAFSSGGASGRVTIRVAPGPVAPTPARMSSVSAWAWARLAWAGGLALAAVGGILALAVVRRRARRPGVAGPVPAPGALLVPYAWALFAVYAGWHIVLFGREVAGI